MEGNLSYIEELGIGEPSVESTESHEEKETNDSPEEDFVQEPETDSDTNETQENTESNELDELRKMIEGMEKRIADKDDYIEKLRNESKQEATKEVDEDKGVDEEDDFWEDPVKKYKELQKTIQIQQMQIQETIYANTVDGYWETVNQDALKEAVATDTEFAEKFNKSSEPYKTAYEYLTAKKQAKVQSEQSLREQIKQELLKEMNIKSAKETVPSTTSMTSKSGGSKRDVSEDGFASVFGDY